MFVDETAATTNMARRYGRRRRGQRLRCGVPHGHYKAITFVFGLRLRGVVAPKAYDHAMNAETFEAWLEHHLLPTLEEGDIVLLDNLKAHKSPKVAEILARKNCTVRYLPPCSPDFNPIEMAISKLKSTLRKLAERPVAGPYGPARVDHLARVPVDVFGLGLRSQPVFVGASRNRAGAHDRQQGGSRLSARRCAGKAAGNDEIVGAMVRAQSRKCARVREAG